MTKTENKEIYTLFFSSVKKDNPHISFEIMDKTDFSIPDLDINGTYMIIGSSHYIEFDNIDYQELFSYKETHHSDDQDKTQIDVSINHPSQMYVEVVEEYNIYTVIGCREIDRFDPNEEFELKHKFGKNAYTTISTNPKSYSSYHTYPEKSVAVHTTTTFEKRN